MNSIEPNNLAELLRRFFQGETTCAEEKALEEYFTSDAPLPAELKPYRDMFGWYASGMDSSSLPSENPETKAASSITAECVSKRQKTRWNSRRLIWWSSAAAIVALTIGLTWQYKTEQLMPAETASIYAESYIVRDGHKITGDAEISGVVQATLLEGTCLDNEIDMLIAGQKTLN